MWTEVKNKSRAVISDGNSSKMVDSDLREQLLHTVQQRNVSAAADTLPSHAEDSLTKSSGIIPGSGLFNTEGCKAGKQITSTVVTAQGAIAATVFIAFILALYAVLWKCMVSPPQRKPSKVRVRGQQRTSV